MAEDAAQDAFVTAWMKLDTLKEPQKFGSWVCKIAKNCALNMLSRYRDFLPLDLVDNLSFTADQAEDPARLYAQNEENRELHGTISKLPQRVGQIVRMYYFEDLSISEIAEKMCISTGTVKWQLHDGRKRIRKELCAMNEKWNDTLVMRVMKKVDEIKVWQFKNNKNGFEKVYSDVIADIEELPESSHKYHALADVLMRGWWWLPGEKNDALFSRIRDAAERGKNDEVMEFIVSREDAQVYGGERIEFIRDKQIPRLEAAGFVRATAREYFWLGHYYFGSGKIDEGRAAYGKASKLLSGAELYGAFAPCAQELEERLVGELSEKDPKRYRAMAGAAEIKFFDGATRFWTDVVMNNGDLISYDMLSPNILRNSSRCDGHFFHSLGVGKMLTGSDGTTLTFESDSVTVETPCGTFDDCELWVTKHSDHRGKHVFRSYYKSGVGIVRHESEIDGYTDTRVLCSYKVTGDGRLPLVCGNSWEYAPVDTDGALRSQLKINVSFADTSYAVTTMSFYIERLRYDENSWLDMIEQMRNEYWHTVKGAQKLCDVSHVIKRVQELASTPMEKAHTKAACSVMSRIMETSREITPGATSDGHWNFFSKNALERENGTIRKTHDPRWSFEWKCDPNEILLYNDIYGILQDSAGCIWSDEWQIGATPIVEYMLWGTHPVKTRIVCEDGGTVSTAAGTFDNCLKLSLDISGLDNGLSYRAGKKEYYFARGIGIVRTVNEYRDGTCLGVYELTSYEGTGEGFMPIENGMIRHYDAVSATDGYVGAAEYTYAESATGEIYVFSDRTGIRVPLPAITKYSSVQGELLEDMLWDEGKWKEAHQKYAANNFHLLLHLFSRPARNRNNAKRSIDLNGFYMTVIESLGTNGDIPPAWYNLYARMALIRAAALFGDNRKEEGYESLEIALKYCKKSQDFEEGDLLDTCSNEVLGGIKYEYGKSVIRLPDGSRDPVEYYYLMSFEASNLLYAITAPRGWEWFNSVRNEERFKEYVERVRKIITK